MLTFKLEGGKFNVRVAGLLFNNDRLLIHKLKSDDFYCLPGGRLEFMENTESTIIREMQEELGIVVKIERLLWVAEHFFELYGERIHEICYYYLLECNDKNLKTDCETFDVVENGQVFEFKWVPRDELANEIFYPTYVKNRIKD